MLPDRVAPSSGRRLYDRPSVSDVDAPALLVHRAVVPPAQGDEVVELGPPAVLPVPRKHKRVLSSDLCADRPVRRSRSAASLASALSDEASASAARRDRV
jgi:hypothetical protein